MSRKKFDWIKNLLKDQVSFDDDLWSEFTGHFKEVKIKKNDYYLKAGNLTNKIGFLKEGILRAAEIKENGDSITHYFYFLPSNLIVTLYEAFSTNTPNEFSVEALTDSVIFEIGREDLAFICEKYPEINNLRLKWAEKHYFMDKQRINSLQNKTAKERYCDFIKNTGDLALQVPQNMIASYLGISQFTLSKIKGKC